MMLLEVVGDGGASLSCHHLARVFPSRCPSVVTAKEREKRMKQETVTYLLPYLYRYLVLLMVAVGEADGCITIATQ